MTLRSRSWVIGRAVVTFSICSAMALASKMPTQIGSTRCPSLSRRITIGVLVMGSTISPLIDISICMALRLSPDAVRARAFDADAHGPADPRCRPRQVDDDVLRRAARDFALATPAGSVDEHVDLAPDQSLGQGGL